MKRRKYLGIDLVIEIEHLYIENNKTLIKEIKDDKNRWRNIPTMFVGWKNQYTENEHSTQSNLYIQCNPYQATDSIFHRTRTNNFRICIETNKTSNIQNSLEKEEWTCRNQPTGLQAILQSSNHQESMVLAQRQKCG